MACLFSTACSEWSDTSKTTPTPDIYVAEGRFSLGGLLPPDESDDRHSWEIEYGNFPHMDGSKSLASAAEAMARHLLNPEGRMTRELVNFSYKSYAMEAFLHQNRESSEILYDEDVPVYLEASTPNLLLLADFMPEDGAYLESGGDTVVAKEFGREATVFIAHADNPVQSLTMEQLKDVLSGTIVNWEEVGGDDQPIKVYCDFEEMGLEMQDFFHSRILKGMGLVNPVEGEQRIPSGIEGGGDYTLSFPAAYHNELGSIGVSLARDAGLSDVKVLEVDGVAPNAESLRSGSYPLYVGCYAVYWERDRDGVPGAFAEWLLSQEGAAVVESAGIIPIGQWSE